MPPKGARSRAPSPKRLAKSDVYVLMYDEIPECIEPATQNALILGVFLTVREAGAAARLYIKKYDMNGHADDDDDDDDDDDEESAAQKKALRKERKEPSDVTLQTRRGWRSGSCSMNFECLESRLRIVRKSLGAFDLHLRPPQSSHDNEEESELDKEDREDRQREKDDEEEEEEEKTMALGGAKAAFVVTEVKTSGTENTKSAGVGTKRKRASKGK